MTTHKDTEVPERIWMRAEVLASAELREHFVKLNSDDIEYRRVDPLAVPTGNYQLDIDHRIYEDDLPADITKSLYDQWFAMSRIVDGVRMGPSVKTVAPATSKQACLKCGHDQTYFTGLCAAYIAGHETLEGTEMVMCGCKCVFAPPAAPDERDKALAQEIVREAVDALDYDCGSADGDCGELCDHWEASTASRIAAALATVRKEGAQGAWKDAMQIANTCLQEHNHRKRSADEDERNPAACVYFALEYAAKQER